MRGIWDCPEFQNLLCPSYLNVVDSSEVPKSYYNGEPGPFFMLLEFIALLPPRRVWGGGVPAPLRPLALRASDTHRACTLLSLSLAMAPSVARITSPSSGTDGGFKQPWERGFLKPLRGLSVFNHLSFPHLAFPALQVETLISSLTIIILAYRVWEGIQMCYLFMRVEPEPITVVDVLVDKGEDLGF